MPPVLITGGHGGIGLECSRYLAANYRSDLILAGRSLDRVEPVARELAKTYGVTVDTLKLDTSSLTSVRAAARTCCELLNQKQTGRLQAILCNAGVRVQAVRYTVDGYEETFATNHLGHFLLLELLMDRLALDGRVVFTASGTHDPDTVDGRLVGAPVVPDAFRLAHEGKSGRKPISAGKRYSTSKLCNVLTAYELDRRLRKSGSTISSNAFDPGSTSGTGFLRSMPLPVRWLSRTGFFGGIQRRLGITMGNVEFSGRSLAQLAKDPLFAHVSGRYFQANDYRLVEKRSSALSYDLQCGLKLWNDSKTLSGLQADEESGLLR